MHDEFKALGQQCLHMGRISPLVAAVATFAEMSNRRSPNQPGPAT
jgi:hypothetical protein